MDVCSSKTYAAKAQWGSTKSEVSHLTTDHHKAHEETATTTPLVTMRFTILKWVKTVGTLSGAIVITQGPD